MARMASQSTRRVRNKRRGSRQRTIQDLNAWEQAYGHQLTNGRRFQKILPYVLSVTAFATLLFWRVPITILAFVVSTFLCWSSLLAKETYISYVRASYSERNRIVNLLTQALSGGDATLFNALKQTVPSMQGELKHEFQILSGLLARSATNDEIHDWFVNEISKYRDDVIFGQYLEQLETMSQEGTYSVDTFINLSRYHNDLYQKQLSYITAKENSKHEVFVIVALVFGLITGLALIGMGQGSGWNQWVKIYAHSVIGNGFSIAFIIIYSMIMKKFMNIYYDESITTYGSDSRAKSIRRNSRKKADHKIREEAEKQTITLTIDPRDNDKSRPLLRTTQAASDDSVGSQPAAKKSTNLKRSSHGFGN